MKLIFNHLKRSLICFLSALKQSARYILWAYYFFTLIFSIDYLSGSADYEYQADMMITIFFFILIIDLSITFVFYVKERADYKFLDFHKYDNELIGKNFIGFKKKDKLFSKALDMLFKRDLKNALDTFISIKEYELTESEKGVLSFYIARCYQIMGYTANALTNYENAESCGFSNDLVPIFKARCCGDMGELDRAVEMYKEVLESGNQYSDIVRTDIGRMYLTENKAADALKWFSEAVERHEDYGNALGGCAIAYTLLHDFEKGEDFYRKAILNHVPDSQGFTSYYKEIQAASLLENKSATSSQKGE